MDEWKLTAEIPGEIRLYKKERQYYFGVDIYKMEGVISKIDIEPMFLFLKGKKYLTYRYYINNKEQLIKLNKDDLKIY